MIYQNVMKPPLVNNQISNEDVNHNPFKNNSAKLQSSQWTVKNTNATVETSKSKCDLASYDKGKLLLIL